MTQRLSKLAEYLYDENFEMAVTLHRQNQRAILDSEEQYLLLAKAYFVGEDYEKAIDILGKIKDSEDIQIYYAARILLYKARYICKQSGYQKTLSKLQEIVAKRQSKNSFYFRAIRQLIDVVQRSDSKRMPAINRQSLIEQKSQYDALFQEQDDNSIVMEGMPMFLVSGRWFDNWLDYVSSGNQKFEKKKEYPGPITQFEITDHIYNIFYDNQSNKEYTNRYLFGSSRYKIIPKKCWEFLARRYGGIEIRRYNISSIDKPYEIITQVYLKRIEIAYMKSEKDRPFFQSVQITKKDNWKGLKAKLQNSWGVGDIFQYSTNSKRAVFQNQILQDVDTAGKRYIYLASQNSKKNGQKSQIKQKCGFPSCGGTINLKMCQCKTIKYCDMECLKADHARHKKKCDLEQTYMKQQSVVFKNFKLEERDYGGKKGLVGLRNLGNTCYMNSGLQCLSNTRELTEYFMKDDFKNQINTSNPLGTRGNLACAYAELIREMWTGDSSVASPFTLKKSMGNFATQFSGFGQQDSQQFISYLIDGLQEDLNLVKKKETFETSDDVKPDEEASRESQINYAKRIQSHIRNLMAGQFKSTVVCLSCGKVSVCFDPYLLISLPIPIATDLGFFLVPSDLTQGALKLHLDLKTNTTFRDLKRAIARQVKYDNSQQPYDQKFLDFKILDNITFQVLRTMQDDECISSIDPRNLIFCLQVPQTRQDEELFLAEYKYKDDRISFPRYLKLSKNYQVAEKCKIIEESLARADKFKSVTYQSAVLNDVASFSEKMKIKTLQINCNRDLKLLTYKEKSEKLKIDNDMGEVSLYDCLKLFTHKEKLQKQNQWFCNKCKGFKPATKQMEIYKSNKILVLAFKRFNRMRKVQTFVNFPIQNFDIGKDLLSNKKGEPIIYDLYGVVNHYGTLGGGHYTAFCQNFLNKNWYEFNDSRVQEINRKNVVSESSYVLFYRRRD